MQKLLKSCALLACFLFMTGCAATTPGLGDDGGTTRLPSGLTLLDSDKKVCDGTVQVDDDTIEDKGLGFQSELFVNPGANATFQFEDGYYEVDWACISNNSSDVDNMRCPHDATHLRITRATTGGELLFECYGSR